MQVRFPAAFVFALAAACHHDPGVMPDATAATDSAPAGSGLMVPWETTPTVPGNVQDTLTVSRVLFRMDSVRVVGDAGPGDSRTAQNSFQLLWSDGQHPDAIDFTSAPTGLYSEVLILADGQLINYSYEISGTVRVSDVMYTYQIHDRNPLGVSLSTSTTLDPGSQANVTIRIDVGNALSSVDWASLDKDGTTITLDTFDSGMDTFRGKLMDSFSVHGSDG